MHIIVLSMTLTLVFACHSSKKSSFEKRKKIQEQRKSKGGCPGIDCT
jgi:hypothetical protein